MLLGCVGLSSIQISTLGGNNLRAAVTSTHVEQIRIELDGHSDMHKQANDAFALAALHAQH